MIEPQEKCSETNRKQTEEVTYVTVLTALVECSSVHEGEY